MKSVNSSFLGIWLFSNFFIGWSRFRGVQRTIYLIRWLAQVFPLHGELLDNVSEKVDLLLQRVPFCFLARKQGCLIRGFLLYFYGKRMGLDIRLCFGSQWDLGKLKSHCWILHKGVIRFEVERVIKDYAMLVEYS